MAAREQITTLTYRGVCDGLRAEYEKARSADDEDVMAYIDEHADEAGCFPEGSPHFGSDGD